VFRTRSCAYPCGSPDPHRGLTQKLPQSLRHQSSLGATSRRKSGAPNRIQTSMVTEKVERRLYGFDPLSSLSACTLIRDRNQIVYREPSRCRLTAGNSRYNSMYPLSFRENLLFYHPKEDACQHSYSRRSFRSLALIHTCASALFVQGRLCKDGESRCLCSFVSMSNQKFLGVSI
jgi:hypothetical protein